MISICPGIPSLLGNSKIINRLVPRQNCHVSTTLCHFMIIRHFIEYCRSQQFIEPLYYSNLMGEIIQGGGGTKLEPCIIQTFLCQQHTFRKMFLRLIERWTQIGFQNVCSFLIGCLRGSDLIGRQARRERPQVRIILKP